MERDMVPSENTALLGLVIFQNEYCDFDKCDECAFSSGDFCMLKAMIAKLKKER